MFLLKIQKILCLKILWLTNIVLKNFVFKSIGFKNFIAKNTANIVSKTLVFKFTTSCCTSIVFKNCNTKIQLNAKIFVKNTKNMC